MTNKYFTEDHDYLFIEDDEDIAKFGITDYAQEQLGDIVFVELSEVGTYLEKGGEAAIVESVKAASEIISPITGEIVESNQQALEENPALMNEDAEGEGYLYKISLSKKDELDALMDEEAYKKFIEELE